MNSTLGSVVPLAMFLGNLDDLDDLKEVKLEPIVAIGQPRWSGS